MASAQGTILRLGSFIFSVSTATYERLSREDEWRWVPQERLNNTPAEQFTGWGSTTISLEGTIYPLFTPLTVSDKNGNVTIVGTNQLEAIRAVANLAQPQTLVDGRGKVFGQFVIVKLHEGQEYILDNGAPRKQDFRLDIRSYGGDTVSTTMNASVQPVINIGNAILNGVTNFTNNASQALSAAAGATAAAGAAVVPTGVAATAAAIAEGLGIINNQAQKIGTDTQGANQGVGGNLTNTVPGTPVGPLNAPGMTQPNPVTAPADLLQLYGVF